MMTSVRKSLFLSFAEKYAVLLIAIASTMILARLLSPAEIGIYSVSVSFIGIALIIRDFGVTQYLIVEKELTRDRIRAAFGITIVISWSIGAVIFLLAGTFADFYNEPSLKQTISILSINFLLIPFGNPVLSLLRREMAFGTILKINIATSLLREGTTVTLAFMGHGFMSLVWGSLTGVAVTALLATIYRPAQAFVLPGFREWRRVLSFGLPAGSTALVSEVGISTPDLVIGKILGFADAGLYSRALGLMNLFSQNVTSAVNWVTLPAYAASHRAGVELGEMYLKSVSYLTVVGWPFFAFLIVMTFPIIRFLFGDQWDACVVLARYFAVAGAIMCLWTQAGQVLMSIGQVRKILYAEIAIQSTRVILIFAAVFHSLEMVAASQIVVYAVGLIIYQLFIRHYLGVSFTDIVRTSFKSLLVTVIAISGPVAVVAIWGTRPTNIIFSLVLASGLFIVCWGAAVFIVRHPIANEVKMIVSQVVQKIQRRKMRA